MNGIELSFVTFTSFVLNHSIIASGLSSSSSTSNGGGGGDLLDYPDLNKNVNDFTNFYDFSSSSSESESSSQIQIKSQFQSDINSKINSTENFPKDSYYDKNNYQSDLNGTNNNKNSSRKFSSGISLVTPAVSSGLVTPILIDPHSTSTSTSTLSPREIAIKILKEQIPENFNKMSQDSRNCVIAYVILFCIGAPGNLTIFITVGREIWRRQLMRSRIKVLIWNLAFADLLVCFVVIPIEIFWRLTVQWYGGDVLCRISQFFRAFGLYLSSMVIICISMDRFFAIVFPLKVIGGMKRVRTMLWVAWCSAILFATPQILVFSVQSSVVYPAFKQCTNQRYFTSLGKEIVYNLLSLTAMYFAPLVIIIVTYAMVLYKIAMKTREHHQNSRAGTGSGNLRRSDNASNITRARRRTLWLSMVIVTSFLICWTPYVAMTMWYMLDFETADKLVDPRIREALFVTAVSNSCVNPIIYGNYMKKYWRTLTQGACQSGSNSSTSSRQIYRPRRPVLYTYSSNSHTTVNNSTIARHPREISVSL